MDVSAHEFPNAADGVNDFFLLFSYTLAESASAVARRLFIAWIHSGVGMIIIPLPTNSDAWSFIGTWIVPQMYGSREFPKWRRPRPSGSGITGKDKPLSWHWA